LGGGGCRRAAEGGHHMLATRWPEKDKRGHNAWPGSRVIHAVADSPTGPFTFQQEIGPGHNVMCYRAKDGTYVLYIIGGAYISKSLDGPWAKYDLQYDLRGTPPVAMSNHSFTPREDGSILMISRAGHVWISEDGLKPFRKITSNSLYPRIPGQFEDPIVWRDEVQYHLIVNDWHGRTAFYLRSPDGVNWTWDQGKAYDIEIVRHPDGTKEGWHKFERPNIRQDSFGRATHLYLAVIDSPKDLDHGDDNHSSKIIALPLTIERRLELVQPQPVTADTRTIQVKVKAEPGFDPAADLDPATLRFGPPGEVNFGNGGKTLRVEPSGADLLVTFDAADQGFKPGDPVAKLLGKSKRGEMVLGYVRLPGHTAATAILSPQPPKLSKPGHLTVIVENFGLAPSAPTSVRITLRGEGGQPQSATAAVPAIQPYASVEVAIPANTDGFAPRKPLPGETNLTRDRAARVPKATPTPEGPPLAGRCCAPGGAAPCHRSLRTSHAPGTIQSPRDFRPLRTWRDPTRRTPRPARAARPRTDR